MKNGGNQLAARAALVRALSFSAVAALTLNPALTPVVASDSPGLRESVVHGKTGYLVRHGDIHDLGEKIVTLLSDDALAQAMAEEGVRWASTFSWERSAEKTLALIEEMLGRPVRSIA